MDFLSLVIENLDKVFNLPDTIAEGVFFGWFFVQYFLILKYIEWYNEAKANRESGKGFMEYIDR